MLNFRVVVVSLLLCSFSLFGATIQDFQGTSGQTSYTLEQNGGSPAASIVNGSMQMLNGAGGLSNIMSFARTDIGMYGRIVAEWDMNIGSGADGYNFALLNTANYGSWSTRGAISAEEEPGLNGSFAIGFDIYDPDDYQNLGPHEISLHLNGVERENRWSSFDYRTSSFEHVKVEIDFVAGGAEITLTVSDNVIYDKYYLFGFNPYESRVSFGARTGGYATTLLLDNIDVRYYDPIDSVEGPAAVVRAYNQILMNGAARDVETTATFPDVDTAYEKVVMRLRVEQPSGGWDGWDRLMHICAWDGNTKYEIARFMTPYSKAGDWYFDVTDYQTILRGDCKISMFCDSWIYDANTGYWFTVDFAFYKGEPEYRVVGIQNLWNGTPMYGDENDQTMSGFFTDKNIEIPLYATKTKLHFMVTGHGQSPNASNAAEFLVKGRTVTVNDSSYYNTLWKNDCYLNPCRPQSGTWIYSRAGWAPGDSVDPWDIDISDDVTPGTVAAIDYEADPFYNSTPNWENVSRHWVESQIVFYEEWNNAPVVKLDMNEAGGTSLVDSSGNDNSGTMTNMAADSWAYGRDCYGLDFDGVDDHIILDGFNGIPGGASRTCCAWIRTNKVNNPVFDWGATGVSGDMWDIRLDGAGALRASVLGGNITGSTSIADGKWHHIAVSLFNDGTPNVNEVVLYVDGQRDTVSSTTAKAIATTLPANAVIGALTAFGHYFEGEMDNTIIYAKALNAAEIYDIFSSSPVPGDLSADGYVDLVDYAIIAQAWLQQTNTDSDMTCDGIVNIDDFEFFSQEWLNQ